MWDPRFQIGLLTIHDYKVSIKRKKLKLGRRQKNKRSVFIYEEITQVNISEFSSVTKEKCKERKVNIKNRSNF